jgi:ATP-dependent Lon protease
MPSQPLNLPQNFNSQVRLFPLSSQVLFPGIVLPLHIFESRYKEMLQEAIQSDQLIAMATLVPGFEHDYYSRPPVEPFVCIGQIVFHEPTDKGTHNLMLLGLERAKIGHEIEPVKSFRRARVEVIEDEDREGDEKGRLIGKQLMNQVSQVLPMAHPLIEKFDTGELSLALLTDIVAFHLPLTTDVKIQLLAQANSATRAKMLIEHMPPVESSSPQKRSYLNRFSDN